MKKRLLAWFSLVVLVSLIAGLAATPAALLPLINQSFLAGLLLLMIGAAAAVIRSGFFTLFSRGFIQLKHVFFKRPRVLESDLYKADDPVFAQKKETFIRSGTSFLLKIGLFLLLVSFGLTCFYYYE